MCVCVCVRVCYLLVVDVDGDPLPEDQLHVGGVCELHGCLDDEVDALPWTGDAVEVRRVVDGRVPRAHARHLHVTMATGARGSGCVWGKKCVCVCSSVCVCVHV